MWDYNPYRRMWPSVKESEQIQWTGRQNSEGEWFKKDKIFMLKKNTKWSRKGKKEPDTMKMTDGTGK